LFSEQTPESLVGAIQSFEEQGLTLSRQQISEASIERFSKEKFMQKIKNVVDKATESRGQG
jgi:hypothetical protein